MAGQDNPLNETGIDPAMGPFKGTSGNDVEAAMRKAHTAIKPILSEIELTFKKIGDQLKADISSAMPSGEAGAGRTKTGTKVITVISKAIGAVTGGEGGGGGAGAIGGAMRMFKTPMAGTIIGGAQQAINAGINAANARFDRGREGVLEADRMSVLYQQMTGLSQLGVSSQYRMPLTNYRLGAGGINTLMNFEAQTGISGRQQASSVEAIRTMSGYSMSTGDVTNMMGTLASAPVANRMFMMTGMGLIGPGGKQNSTMQVMQNLVNVAGLTSKEVIDSAMLPGSVTRAKLTSMGVPPEMQTQVIQYAKQNLTYKNKGGRGMYDPSNKTSRRLMGVEENFATQVEESQRLETKRDETFYRRQVDNYAHLERQTQSLTRAFGALEDKLSGMLGFTASNRIATTLFQGLPSMGGDPGGSSTGVNTSSPNVSSARNSASFKKLHPKMQDRLIKMLSDNPNVRFGNGVRSADEQRRMFLSRYRKTNKEYDDKGNKNVMWEGSYYEHVSGHVAAPPGRSMHEIGLAADLDGDLEWVVANASKYGLKHFANVNNEPHHVQPSELPNSRSQYEKGGAGWGHGPADAVAFSGKSDFGDELDHSTSTKSAVRGSGVSSSFSYGGSISERVSRRLGGSGSSAVSSPGGGRSRIRGVIKSSTGTSVVNNDLGNFKHGGMARSGVDIGQWSAEFLKLVGAPVSLANLEAMAAWIAAEGTAAKFNPLAVVSKPTAEAMGGTGNLDGWTPFNKNGNGKNPVLNFANYQQGLMMNAYHVKNHGKGVIAALQKGSNNPYDVITAIERMVKSWTTDVGHEYAARSWLESKGVGTNVTGNTGDPAVPVQLGAKPTAPGSMAVIGGHTFNISPSITMNGNGAPQDLQKIARDLAVMVRRELELESLRSA
jgi:hypothetical protein